jgi:hypothetical protein
MRIKMTIEVELDDAAYHGTEDEKLWLENEILVGDGNLILHSNEIGDEVGVIKSVKNIQYIKS